MQDYCAFLAETTPPRTRSHTHMRTHSHAAHVHTWPSPARLSSSFTVIKIFLWVLLSPPPETDFEEIGGGEYCDGPVRPRGQFTKRAQPLDCPPHIIPIWSRELAYIMGFTLGCGTASNW